MLRYIILLLCCFIVLNAVAQSPKKDRVLANQYLRDARIFKSDGAYDQSNKLLRAAMNMYAKMGMWVKYCSTKKSLINNYETTDQWDSVRVLQEDLLKESVKHLGKNNRFEKQGYVTLGEAYIYRKQPDYAIPFLEEGLDIFDSKVIGREEEKTKLYTLLGMAYELRGEHKLALSYFEKAKEYVENNKVFELPVIAQWDYNYSKALFRSSQLDKALMYAKKSLTNNQALYTPNSQKSAESLLLLAEIQAALGNYDNAINNIGKAIQALSKTKKTDPLLVQAYRESGSILGQAGKIVKAKEALSLGIEKALKIFGKKHPETAACYLAMAQLSLTTQDLEYGIRCTQNGMLSLLPFSNDLDVDLKYEPVLSSSIMLQTIQLEQQLLKALYTKTSQAAYLEKIHQAALKSEQLRIQIQSEYFNLYERTTLSKLYQKTYAEAIAAQISLAEKQSASQKSNHYQQALIWAERSKQFQKRSLLYINTVRMTGGLSEEMKVNEVLLLKGMSQLKFDMINASMSAPEMMAPLKEKWELQLKKFDNWLLELKKTKSSYYYCFYQLPDLRIGDLEAILQGGKRVLIFIEGPDSYFRFWLSNKELTAKSLAKSPDIETSLSWLFGYLSDSEAAKDKQKLKQFSQESAKLYTWLLGDILSVSDTAIHQLSILGDGDLRLLPFELLLQDQPTEQTAEWPYLIQQVAINYFWTINDIMRPSYAPSGTELLLANTNYKNLPAIREMRDLYRIAQVWSLGGTGNKYRRRFKGKFQLNLEATERTLTQTDFNGFAAFQPAFYADFSELNPMLSRLLLSYEKDSLFDGAWYAYEVCNLSIPIQLLVLNGVGDSMLLNDSKMALLLAFDYSGTETTLWPLWRQHEADERKIIQSYYEQLAKGLNKTEALRQAKIQFLEANNGIKAAPHYWASFKLTGIDGKVAIVLRNRFPWIPVSIGAVFLLSIFALWWRRWRAKKAKRLITD